MRHAMWVRGGLLVALAVGSGMAGAKERPYLGVGGSLTALEESGWASVDAMPAVQVVAGTDLNPYLGIEARLQYGVLATDGDLTPSASALFTSAEYNLGFSYALYLKPQIALGNGARLYALAGYGMTQIELEAEGPLVGKLTSVGRDDVMSYGAGVLLGRADKTHFALDYLIYDGFEDKPRVAESEIETLSLTVRFPIN